MLLTAQSFRQIMSRHYSYSCPSAFMKVRLLVGASIVAVAGCALAFLYADGRLSTLFGRGRKSSITADHSPEVVWLFETPEHGAIVAVLLVEGARVFGGVV